MKDRRPPSGSPFSCCPGFPRFSAEGHKNRQTRTVERTLTGTIRTAGNGAEAEGQSEEVFEGRHMSSQEGKTNREGRYRKR